MNYLSKMFFLFVIAIPYIMSAQIRILLTAALTDAHYEFRKDEYIHAFNTLKNLGYEEFYIVEALKKGGHTFLDEYSSHVLYATANDPLCKNQGVNESRTMLEALDYFDFDPEDMIIKLTGRHRLISDFIIKMVENNPDCDVFFKYCKGMYPAFFDGMVPTMCFAMRCKFLREMYATIDYKKMQQENMPIEWLVPAFINRMVNEGKMKSMILDKLDIRVNAFASSASPGLAEKIVIF
ncbi:MAG: hypothetical protein AMXMBFR12_06590 [Candidatus Babeliales bacterium]